MKANEMRELIREHGVDIAMELIENEFVEKFNQTISKCIFWFSVGALLATLITFYCLH